MGWFSKALSKVTDDWLGIDPPKMPDAPAAQGKPPAPPGQTKPDIKEEDDALLVPQYTLTPDQFATAATQRARLRGEIGGEHYQLTEPMLNEEQFLKVDLGP